MLFRVSTAKEKNTARQKVSLAEHRCIPCELSFRIIKRNKKKYQLHCNTNSFIYFNQETKTKEWNGSAFSLFISGSFYLFVLLRSQKTLLTAVVLCVFSVPKLLFVYAVQRMYCISFPSTLVASSKHIFSIFSSNPKDKRVAFM